MSLPWSIVVEVTRKDKATFLMNSVSIDNYSYSITASDTVDLENFSAVKNFN